MSIGTTTTNPVATKPHRCEFCGRAIDRGERYARVRGQWEREWQNWAAHTICLDIGSGAGEFEVYQYDWRDLAEMTTSAEQLEAFLQRFPPAEEDPDEGETQAAYAARQFERLGRKAAA